MTFCASDLEDYIRANRLARMWWEETKLPIKTFIEQNRKTLEQALKRALTEK